MRQDADSHYSVHDAGDLKKYRIELPNLVDDSELSVYGFRLYAHYKRRAGAAAGGVCNEGTRATAAHCKMSTGQVSAAKAELENGGLIHIDRPDGGTNQADRITIVDIGPRISPGTRRKNRLVRNVPRDRQDAPECLRMQLLRTLFRTLPNQEMVFRT